LSACGENPGDTKQHIPQGQFTSLGTAATGFPLQRDTVKNTTKSSLTVAPLAVYFTEKLTQTFALAV